MGKRARDPGDGGGRGPSQRQLRVGESLRRSLADILLRGETHDPDLARHSITVTEVRASPDLRNATVYYLSLGGRDEASVETALNRNAPALRRLLARTVELKYAPELRFLRDDSFDRMDAANRLFSDESVRRDLSAERDDGAGPDGSDA